MKKLIALLLILAFATTLLSGCGASVKKDDLKDEVHLIWYTLGTTPEDNALVTEEVNKYLKGKINATIEFRYIEWGDYDPKIKTITTAGEPFDFMFTSTWINDFTQNVAAGKLLPLNDLIDQYGKEMKAAIDPVYLEYTRINGINYAIPTNKEQGTIMNYALNKNIASKYNIDITKILKTEDWEPVFAKIKPDHIYGFSIDKNNGFVMPEYDFIIDSKYPGAVRMDDPTCKVINQFESPEFINELKTYRRFYQKGYIRPDAFTIDWATAINDFSTGKSAVMFAEDIHTAIELLPNNVDWLEKQRKAPLELQPCFPKPIINTRSLSVSMIGISATSQHPERAMMFLNLLNSDKYLRNLVGFGIENVHYKKIDADTIDLLPRSTKYTTNQGAFGNCLILYGTLDSKTGKKTYEGDYSIKVKAVNANSIKSPLLGFYFNPTPVKTEIAAIVNNAHEFTSPLYTGAIDPEEGIKNYMEKARDAGMDKVLAEMQKQIDEWKKTRK